MTDTHEPDIETWVSVGPSGSQRSWRAHCSCGWQGRSEHDPAAASDAFDDHKQEQAA